MSAPIFVPADIRSKFSAFRDPAEKYNNLKKTKVKYNNINEQNKKEKPQYPEQEIKILEEQLTQCKSDHENITGPADNIGSIAGYIQSIKEMEDDIKNGGSRASKELLDGCKARLEEAYKTEQELREKIESIPNEIEQLKIKYENDLKEFNKESSKIAEQLDSINIEIENLNKNNQVAEAYSFRNKNNLKRIQIFPPFLCDDTIGTNFNEDISNKQIYGFNSNKSITLIDDILQNIPAIEIREYQPDYKVSQAINLMQKFAEGFEAYVGESGNSDLSLSFKDKLANAMAKTKEAISNIQDTFQKIWKNVENIPTLFESALSSISYAPLQNGYEDTNQEQYKTTMVAIPYIFYHRLMGYTTTNYYTIPFSGSYEIMKSVGTTGWSTDVFDISNGTAGGRFLGKLAGGFLENLKINRNPKWTPGTMEDGPQYSITFSLYNNSLDAAINNYLFINSIIPGNLSLQYTLLHQAPSLYDIKIEGGPRMFCCAATFTCTYKGVLRSVPKEFISHILKKYGNKLTDIDKTFEKKLIKIPDIYQIQCTFKSLIPNTFNEYMWRFAQPDMDPIAPDINGHVDDLYTDMLTKSMKAVTDFMFTDDRINAAVNQDKTDNTIITADGKIIEPQEPTKSEN